MITTTVTCPIIEADKPGRDDQTGLDVKRPADAFNLASGRTWLVEVEDDGTIIHSRSNGFEASESPSSDMTGRNFFEDVPGLADSIRCWQHFRTFVKSKKAVESCVWQLRADRGSSEAKVQMTRAFCTSTFPPTGVVMMEIKTAN